MTRRGGAVICGLGEVGPLVPDGTRNAEALTLDAIERAAADAGIAVRDIDAIVKYSHDTSFSLLGLATNLACHELRYAIEIPYGGGAAGAALDVAKLLVTSGNATTVLCLRTIVGHDWVARMNEPDPVRPHYLDIVNYLRPVGWSGYLHTFAALFGEHAARYGTTRADLGEIACQLSANAVHAASQVTSMPVTMDQYLAAPLTLGPFCEYDDFAVADTACAVIVTSAQRAAQVAPTPVVAEIVGAAQSQGGAPMAWFDTRPLADPVADSPVRAAVRATLDRAGVSIRDIDVAHLYDCTTFAFLHILEESGLCEPGEARQLVADQGSLSSSGQRPCNTAGGDLAGGYSHGFRHILEGCRQVTGRSANQVADAETTLVVGAPLGPTSAAVLRRMEVR